MDNITSFTSVGDAKAISDTDFWCNSETACTVKKNLVKSVAISEGHWKFLVHGH